MSYSAHLSLSNVFCKKICHFKSPWMNFTGKYKSKQKEYIHQFSKLLSISNSKLLWLFAITYPVSTDLVIFIWQ